MAARSAKIKKKKDVEEGAARSSFVPLCEQQEDDEATESQPTQEKVIALINQAQLEHKQKKMECLHQVKELIIKKDPNLLDSFLDEVIAFQQDQSPDVRKFVVQFMEDACKTDVGLLVRVIPMLSYMMEDTHSSVIKRVMTAFMQLYTMAFMYTVKSKSSLEDMKEMWETLHETKLRALDMLEAENDGIRTMAIKFMEIVILAQTPKEPKSEPPKVSEFDVSLDIIPASHEMLDTAELQEEAGRAIGSLLALTASPVLSSVSLQACISCLTNIARQRPSNISTVIQSFELLHANLPPHFATSQVTSVRKQMKSQVLSLLRHPSSLECREQITALLTDLGCTQADIVKNTPKPESLKRTRVDGDGNLLAKKIKLSEVALESAGGGSEVGEAGDHRAATGSGYSNIDATEMTAADLKSVLTPETVTDLVMVSIRDLPRHMPRMFRNSYTPIAAAGTDAQVSHLARLLASQMTAVGIGVGAEAKNIQPQPSDSPPHQSPTPLRVVSDPRRKISKEGSLKEGGGAEGKKVQVEDVLESPHGEPSVEKLAESMTELAFLGSLLGMPNIFDPMFPATYASFFGSYPPWMKEGVERMKEEVDQRGGSDREPGKASEDGVPASPMLSNLVTIPTSKVQEEPKEPVKKDKKPHVAPTPQKLKRIRMFDLSDAVKQMKQDHMKTMALQTFRRILTTEKITTQGGMGQARISIIINLVTQFGGSYDSALLEFILEDLRANFDLAIAWLFAEYSITENYCQSARNTPCYDACLTALLKGARDKFEPRDRLFTRLVLEAPKITSSAMEIVRSYCCTEDRAFLGVTTLKELVLKRPHGPQGTEDFLQALLEVTMSSIELARVQALHVAKKFYGKPELTSKIERFALQSLQYLLADFPPFQEDSGDMEVASEWTEETVSLCLQLFVSLLPLNHKLLKDLAMIYTTTTPTVKRIILKHIDKPVRAIGMSSPDLLRLVESCPAGGEILIMRMLYILTENVPPSVELVGRVRELYNHNPSDVRFLIPVLYGLQKSEVITALPKFIKLSPNLVKSVFDRLLLSYKGDQGHSISPVSPSELLIALHNINCSHDETLMKAAIKAINMCFAEKAIYTQEVLAVVLQQLLDHSPVPVLFMRTVIQSLSAYPKLVNFVMTILTKLISKQVWKQPTVWQGFVKCCEVTKPNSFPVLLQLPQKQLQSLLESRPGLREGLVGHIQTLLPHQRVMVPRPLLQSLELVAVGDGEASKRKRRESSHRKRRHSSKSSGHEKENSS